MKLYPNQPDPKEKLSFINVNEHPLDWTPNNWAVLGLSPISSFVNYLKANNNGIITLNLTSELK